MNLKKIPALLLTLLILMSVITVPVFAANVAKIGDTEYASLQAAVNAAPTDNTQTTITLLSDTTETITVYASQNVILDLNGKILSSAGITITNNGTLKVVDSSNNKSGKITSTGAGAVKIMGDSVTTLYGITVEADQKGVFAMGVTATVTIDGCNITSNCKAQNSGAVHITCSSSYNPATKKMDKKAPEVTLAVLNSTLTAKSTSYSGCGCIYLKDAGTLNTITIYNTELTAEENTYQIYALSGSFTFNTDKSKEDFEFPSDGVILTINSISKYTISTSATNGTITCYYEGAVNGFNGFHKFDTPENLAFGTRIFITVEPANGYKFDSLTVGSEVYKKDDMTNTTKEGITRYKDSGSTSTLLTDDPVSGFMITMPASDTTVTASFSEITYFKNTTTNTEYSKIETAISEAKAGETVIMLADTTLDTYPELTNTTAGVTFDLNGKTLTVSKGYTLNTLNEAHNKIDSYPNFYAISLTGNITVKNGTITTPCAYTFQTQSNSGTNSNIVLEDITTDGGLNFNKTTATVTNVTANASTTNASTKEFYAIYIGGSGSKITVNGGYYKAGKNKHCLYLDNDDTTGDQLVIWGGTFEGYTESGENCFYVPGTSNPSSIHIYKGIFNGTPDSDKNDTNGFDYVDEKSTTYVRTKGDTTNIEHWWTVDWNYNGEKVVEKNVYSSLTLVDDISINYLFPNGDDGFTDYDIGLLTVSVDGIAVELEECTDGWKIKKAKSFAPAEIGNTTKLKIQIAGTNTYKEYTYSVLQYCASVCTAAENTYDSKLVTLCSTLVHYGNECQNALSGATEGNTLLSQYCNTVTYSAVPETTVSYEGTENIISAPSAVLTLTGKVGISVSFKAGENAEIKVDGKKQSAERDENGVYTVTISEKIAPYALDMEHYIKVTVNGESQAMKLSPVTCMYYLSVNGSNDNQKNLAKAFYAYHIAAKAYKTVFNG